jgi:hypothetical protein
MSHKLDLSILRSANNRFSFAFLYSSYLSRRTAATPMAPNFFFHRVKARSHTPSQRQISAIVWPVQPCDKP